MGSVYLLRSKETGDYIALKIMQKWLAEDDRAARRFLREMEIMRGLKHPNIVGLLDIGRTEETVFYTMEYCEKGNLADYVRWKWLIPLDEVIDISFQILDAIGYAHKAEFQYTRQSGEIVDVRGVIHRDLKPQNVFLSNSNGRLVAKIGDFGLAKALMGIEDPRRMALETVGMRTTEEGDWSGTPEYMSYDQYKNFFDPTPSMDIWSAAATIYFMLARKPPRGSYRQKGLKISKLNEYFERSPVSIARASSRRVPKLLAKIIDEALRMDWPFSGKVESAEDLKRALEAAYR
jgi:serine/threonine protein kinase